MLKISTINIKPGPGIYALLNHLDISYENCIAELIDNSFDNFDLNGITDGVVKINYDSEKRFLIYIDNGNGLDQHNLEKSLQAANSDKNKINFKGLYGVGFNIAMSKLSTKTEIFTKTSEAKSWLSCVYDPNQIKKQGNFNIDLNHDKIPPIESTLMNYNSGLVLIIYLSNDAESKFSSNKYRNVNLRNQIAKIYSYSIRTKVPGLSDIYASHLNNKYKIFIDDKEVKPYLPCIWDEKRTVKRSREEVSAVETFKFDLATQKKCNECGKINPESSLDCNNCNSDDLNTFDANLWGWIGVQRHLHEDHFGFDFIRNGRKILINNKELFKYTDDNNNTQIEYPVEMPANRGRIVGEIHCDFLTPTAVKNDFERNERNWYELVRLVRGNSPLKPQSRQKNEQNDSPLSIMFSRFRRNEKGLQDLQIGSGKQKFGNLEVALKWFRNFHEGLDEYQTDEKWYQSAKIAQEEKDGVLKSNDNGNVTQETTNPGNKTFITEILDTPDEGSNSANENVKSQKEQMDDWEKAGFKLDQFSGIILIKSKNGRITKDYEITTFLTKRDILKDNTSLNSEIIQIDGRHIKIYINDDHDDWKYIEKDNIIISNLCRLITQAAGTNFSYETILNSICKRFNEPQNYENIKEQEDEFKAKLAKLMTGCFSKNSLHYYNLLAEAEQIKVKEIINNKNLNFEEKIKNGEFTQYLSFNGFMEMIEKNPKDFMDGRLFDMKYLHDEFTKNANKKTLGYLSLSFSVLNNITETLHNIREYSSYEKDMILSSIKFLDDKLVIK